LLTGWETIGYNYWNATALDVTWGVPLTGLLVNVEDASGGSRVDRDYFKMYLNKAAKR